MITHFYEFPFIKFDEKAEGDIFLTFLEFAFEDLKPLLDFGFELEVNSQNVIIKHNAVAMGKLIEYEMVDSYQEEYNAVKVYLEKHSDDVFPEEIAVEAKLYIQTNLNCTIQEVIDAMLSKFDLQTKIDDDADRAYDSQNGN